MHNQLVAKKRCDKRKRERDGSVVGFGAFRPEGRRFDPTLAAT